MTFTGSVSTAGSSGGANFNDNSEGKTTPQQFNVDEDARGMEGGGQYPNYWSHKTRSGHNFIMDDSKGNETITIQHRSGTAIQMRPDGGMLLTTHNGKYEVVLGEERVTISGASDITVKGDTSLRCYGDYNVTVHKDYNLTVLGNMNMTCKNLNRQVRGTMDTEAKTDNKRVEGTKTTNVLGAFSQVSTGDFSIATTKGKLQAVAAAGHASFQTLDSSKNLVVSSAGKMYQHSGDAFHGTYASASGVGAGKYGAINPSSTQIMHKVKIDSMGYSVITDGPVIRQVKQGDFTTTVDQGNHSTKVMGNHSVKSTTGNIQSQATAGNIVHKAVAGSVDIRAPAGTTTVAGGMMNINALSGMLGIAGSAGISLDSLGSLLNLNGGIASIASALGLDFIFGTANEADTPPQLQGTQANQPTQEPDATGEIDSWQ